MKVGDVFDIRMRVTSPPARSPPRHLEDEIWTDCCVVGAEAEGEFVLSPAQLARGHAVKPLFAVGDRVRRKWDDETDMQAGTVHALDVETDQAWVKFPGFSAVYSFADLVPAP